MTEKGGREILNKMKVLFFKPLWRTVVASSGSESSEIECLEFSSLCRRSSLPLAGPKPNGHYQVVVGHYQIVIGQYQIRNGQYQGRTGLTKNDFGQETGRHGSV